MDLSVGLYTYSVPAVADKLVINFIKLNQASFPFLLDYLPTKRCKQN